MTGLIVLLEQALVCPKAPLDHFISVKPFGLFKVVAKVVFVVIQQNFFAASKSFFQSFLSLG